MKSDPTDAVMAAEPSDVQPNDALTGLCSRAALHRVLGLSLQDARTGTALPALLALDLDRFQAINDSTSIATGDGVLSRVAKRIQGAVPAGATVARISGDEFAVLLPDGSQGETVAARLLELIARPYAVNGHAMTLSVSIGLARAHSPDQDADSLLQAATIALHRAEADGKNRWCLFEPWMQEHASTRQALEMDLRAALAVNRLELRKAMAVEQFEVHYQPQVDARSWRLLGFEALVRWRHPARGMIGPDLFIPLAEEIGLIGLLGDWVLKTACETAAQWPAPAQGRPYQIAVNVSPLQLREKRALVASIADALARSGLAPERLEIEITESALIGDALETLQSIKALGVSLSLDDFGTGYSSLSQLAHYPFDRLKIDRSFVRELPTGAEVNTASAKHAVWMLQAIASLGAGLGMSTVAEGVETEAQAEMVRQAGVGVVQGYLVARPTPPAELSALVRRLQVDADHAGNARASSQGPSAMTLPLFSLAYFSRNTIGGTADEMHAAIASILASARRNNARHGVTGALLFSDGCFAQVLEGGREDIEAIFETIQCDPRHSDVTIMHLHEIEERSFGKWSMAFGGIDGVSVDPRIQHDGMGPVDGILATKAGASLLAALRSVVHRDDLARRDERAAPSGLHCG